MSTVKNEDGKSSSPMFIPATMSCSSMSTVLVLGPIVATMEVYVCQPKPQNQAAATLMAGAIADIPCEETSGQV